MLVLTQGHNCIYIYIFRTSTQEERGGKHNSLIQLHPTVLDSAVMSVERKNLTCKTPIPSIPPHSPPPRTKRKCVICRLDEQDKHPHLWCPTIVVYKPILIDSQYKTTPSSVNLAAQTKRGRVRTYFMEFTQTLQPPHFHPNGKLLKTDDAFLQTLAIFTDTVLLTRMINYHARGPSSGHSRAAAIV